MEMWCLCMYVLTRGANESLIHCWCEDKPILANSWIVYTPTIQPSHSPPRYPSWRNGNTRPYKQLSMNVQSSFTDNHPKLETIGIAINRWMNKPLAVLSLQDSYSTGTRMNYWYTQHKWISKWLRWLKEARQNRIYIISHLCSHIQWWLKTE